MTAIMSIITMPTVSNNESKNRDNNNWRSPKHNLHKSIIQFSAVSIVRQEHCYYLGKKQNICTFCGATVPF